VISAVLFGAALPIYLVVSFVVVAFEGSGHYVEAAAVTVVAVMVDVYVLVLPGLGRSRFGAARSIGRGHWKPPTPGRGRRLP